MINRKTFIDKRFAYMDYIVTFGAKDKRSKNLRCKKYAKNNGTAVRTWPNPHLRNQNKS
jgi:hypothetical protein